ncbi:ZIP zinc transporter [Lutibacter oceani]|uniref:ZIP zinc transporter n=1 Tax=Lutibacter oceani TaxID=1853311 RepID=A0A3D9RPW4_9FLAO|nr:ZIP family metal transporter [Lutibacter oceani]REE81940.1 ZIP zinc transporter [Lutibacter oceani]
MTYIALILSVLIGMVIVFGLKPSNKTVQLLLAFSGAYLLSITILHLFPEVYITENSNIGLYILIGLLLQLILDFFSKGAEHGHIHIQDNIVFPWALFISLGIHAFMEGIPLANNHHHEHLLWAIVIHKIPIAIILSTFFVKSQISKKYAVLFLVIFSLMSPLGRLAGENFQLLVTYKTEITAIIIGVFLHISTIILFETSKDHKFNLLKFIAILVGMVVAYLA